MLFFLANAVNRLIIASKKISGIHNRLGLGIPPILYFYLDVYKRQLYMMGMRAKKICMAMLLIVGGIVAVFLAHRKVAEKITEEEYQRFLDGEVPAMKENGKTYFLEDLFGEDVSDVETFLSDIDGDGVKELHIRNGIYYILKEKKGKLTIL